MAILYISVFCNSSWCL